MDENARVKDRVELSLDGRQIASIVVGALVLLGVVFVLGVNVGKQLVARQLEAARGDDLAALDQPPPVQAPREEALTYHDRLVRERAPAEERSPEPAQAATPDPTATARATSTGAPTPTPTPTPTSTPAATQTATAAPSPTATAKAAFSVQVAATPNRAEAERLAARLGEFSPRVEAADVAGKGRFYRVRVGAYSSRADAERAAERVSARAGSKALVVASR